MESRAQSYVTGLFYLIVFCHGTLDHDGNAEGLGGVGVLGEWDKLFQVVSVEMKLYT